MREIVSVGVGGCGNQLNNQFWKTICKEHGVDTSDGRFKGDSDLQLERINVYFNEATGGRYVPRVALVDLNCDPLNSIRAGPQGSLYSPDSYVHGYFGSCNIGLLQLY